MKIQRLSTTACSDKRYVKPLKCGPLRLPCRSDQAVIPKTILADEVRIETGLRWERSIPIIWRVGLKPVPYAGIGIGADEIALLIVHLRGCGALTGSSGVSILAGRDCCRRRLLLISRICRATR